MSFFSDEEKDVVSVDGTEVYAKSHEEDLTKEGGNGLMPSCVCSLKIHHKSLHKDTVLSLLTKIYHKFLQVFKENISITTCPNHDIPNLQHFSISFAHEY